MKSPMDYVKYQNICKDCGIKFTSLGWMRAHCKDCLTTAQNALRLSTSENGYLRYTINKRRIFEKNPELAYRYPGKYKGISCHTTLELAFVVWALNEQHPIKRSSRIIYYKLNGKPHRFRAAFEINGTIYEIKEKLTPKEIAKQSAAQEQNINIIFIDKEKCEFYFEYVYSKFGKDPRDKWIALYDNRLKPRPKTQLAKPIAAATPQTLSQIMEEPDPLLKKEKLFNNYKLLRSEQSARIAFLLHVNGPSPGQGYTTLLRTAIKFLYPNLDLPKS